MDIVSQLGVISNLHLHHRMSLNEAVASFLCLGDDSVGVRQAKPDRGRQGATAELLNSTPTATSETLTFTATAIIPPSK